MKNRRIWYVVSCLLCIVLALTGCGSSGTTDMDTIPNNQTEERASSFSEAQVNENRGMNDTGTVKKQLENSKVIEQTEAYTVYELSFERDGMNIYGQFYIPSGNASQYPITIIGHGFASSYSYTAAYAEYLAKAGIAAYVFDFCGGSSYSESDGSMKDMSVLTERNDMETVLNGILQFDFVETDNVFLMGESQGGMVAALLAAKRSEDVKGLVLFYPAFVIPDYARSFYSDVSQVPKNPTALGRMVGRRYYTDVIDMNVYDEIKGYEKDVLIVHGNNDNTVPISYSERAIKTYSSAQLLVMDGARHGFSGSQLQDACNEAVDFINSHINQTK